MKKTLTEQYRLIKEDKGHKGVFLKEAKKQFPNLIRQGATYNEASKILKQRNIISENFVGIPMVGNPLERKKEGYENAFENFLAEAKSLKDIIKSTKVDGSIEDLEKAVMAKAKKEGLNVTQKEVEDAVEKHADSAMGLFEAKAEEKKVSKEVEEDQANGYDTLDKKDPNNMIFGQIQMGYYCEYKDPKNEGKTDQELLKIVYKNLAKDPIFYTKNGQFGEQDLGYTNEAPSLGEPVEPKGEYKSSGYGKLKEHSISMAGGIVSGTGFSHKNYMDYFNLNEGPKEDAEELKTNMDAANDSAGEFKATVDSIELEEDRMDGAPEHMEAVADAVEMAYEAGMSIEEITEFVEQHLGLKMGDY